MMKELNQRAPMLLRTTIVAVGAASHGTYTAPATPLRPLGLPCSPALWSGDVISLSTIPPAPSTTPMLTSLVVGGCDLVVWQVDVMKDTSEEALSAYTYTYAYTYISPHIYTG